jgi:hypothetical protein
VSSGYSAKFFAASKQRNSNSVQGIFMYEKFNTVDQDHKQWISPELIVKGFKKCCIADEMDGREDHDEVENFGSGHENVSSECKTEHGICEDSEAEKVMRMVN